MKLDRLPPLRLLSVFETVLRSGGVQRAARELNVSQPAVSQAVRLLESHLGFALFDRRSRPATLTEGGRLLARAVSEGFERITEAIAHGRSLAAGAERSLTIACTVGTATYWLMPSLTGFHGQHGDIAVSVRTTAQGIPRLLPGVDLAIRYGDGNWSDGAARLLFRERIVPVCSPALFERLAGEGFALSAPLLHVDAEIANWMEWPAYLAQVGLPVPARPGMRFTNYVQATQAALGGLGVILGWRSNAASFLSSGELVELPLPAVVPKEAFYIVTPRGAAPSPLIDWLIQAGAELEAQPISQSRTAAAAGEGAAQVT
ncbi:LysR substrate-binding domain-containing protein [Paenirhodobacter sp.]|uniref:LysR substrate-binding domain-containing protein n=1 Tax=Paenirhodobacter sp. TaxID=1965326 RepID=UPI003B3C4FFD